MANPWEEIDLSDYENHMKLNSVMQLQTINSMMKGQLGAYPANSVMILGIAGGNGLEHIDTEKYSKVYGVDINPKYLKEAHDRYPDLKNVLDCLCVDLMSEFDKLPHADLVVANLLIEYIGYECFQKTIQQIKPEYVTCIIQINAESSFVSDSPYLHVFDGLNKVHHQMEENKQILKMKEIGYRLIKKLEQPLPNGKLFVQLDFICDKGAA